MNIKRGTKVKILAIRNKYLEASIIGTDGFVRGARSSSKRESEAEYLVELDGCLCGPFLEYDLEVLPKA